MIIKFTSDSVLSCPLTLINEATLLVGTALKTKTVLKAGTQFSVSTEINGILIPAGTIFPVDLILLHDYVMAGVIIVTPGSFFPETTGFKDNQYIEVEHRVQVSSGSFIVIDDCDDCCFNPTGHCPDDCCFNPTGHCPDPCCDKDLECVCKLIEKIIDQNCEDKCVLKENCKLKLKLQKQEYEEIIRKIKRHCHKNCDSPRSHCDSPRSHCDSPRSHCDSPRSHCDSPRSHCDSPRSHCDSPLSCDTSVRCDSPRSHCGFKRCYIPEECGCECNCLKKILFKKIVSNVEVMKIYELKFNKLKLRHKDYKDKICEIKDYIKNLERSSCGQYVRNTIKKCDAQILKCKNYIKSNLIEIESITCHINVLISILERENFVYKHLNC